jgi:hypothetical protein
MLEGPSGREEKLGWRRLEGTGVSKLRRNSRKQEQLKK